ncbi:MAG TPA: VOC family protein [Candidatus Dormibacteraeota bacterium]
MAETRTSVANRPAWVDLSTSDPAAAHQFYSKVFGWQIEVSPDPQYGGYAMAKVDGHDVAGIGPQMAPGAPPAWSVYIGTTDAGGLAQKVQAAGGTVVAPAFDVGDQGKMAVFQDPTGAFISAWEPAQMGEFHHGAPNQYGWAELSARGFEKAAPFYREVFGWEQKTSPMGDTGQTYTEFQVGEDSVAGGMEMNPMVPAEVPSYWMPYFIVADIDATFKTALDAGGKELVPPSDYPTGRFAIIQDPQGASFGLISS